MTAPRERAKHIANLRRIAERYQDATQRELDRPKLCDRNQPVPSTYNQLADMHAALRWALRELDPDYMPRTWPEIVQEADEGVGKVTRQAMEEDG